MIIIIVLYVAIIKVWSSPKRQHLETRQSTPSRRVPETQTQLSAIGLTHCVPKNDEMIEAWEFQDDIPCTSS